MNLMLVKYCLTIVFKKKREREMKRWHAKEAWPKKREREKMACQRSMTQQIKSDMKRSMYLSIINKSVNLWIQSLILQQIWAKQTVFYLIHRDSTYTIKTGEVKQRQEVMSDSERPMEESKTMNSFLKFFSKKLPSLATWQDNTWS